MYGEGGTPPKAHQPILTRPGALGLPTGIYRARPEFDLGFLRTPLRPLDRSRHFLRSVCYSGFTGRAALRHAPQSSNLTETVFGGPWLLETAIVLPAVSGNCTFSSCRFWKLPFFFLPVLETACVSLCRFWAQHVFFLQCMGHHYFHPLHSKLINHQLLYIEYLALESFQF